MSIVCHRLTLTADATPAGLRELADELERFKGKVVLVFGPFPGGDQPFEERIHAVGLTLDIDTTTADSHN